MKGEHSATTPAFIVVKQINLASQTLSTAILPCLTGEISEVRIRSRLILEIGGADFRKLRAYFPEGKGTWRVFCFSRILLFNFDSLCRNSGNDVIGFDVFCNDSACANEGIVSDCHA